MSRLAIALFKDLDDDDISLIAALPLWDFQVEIFHTCNIKFLARSNPDLRSLRLAPQSRDSIYDVRIPALPLLQELIVMGPNRVSGLDRLHHNNLVKLELDTTCVGGYFTDAETVIVSDSIHLRSINIRWCELQGLELVNCTNLEIVKLNFNAVYVIRLKGCPLLKSFEMTTDRYGIELSVDIQDCPGMIDLTLDKCSFDIEQIKDLENLKLLKILQTGHSLRHLSGLACRATLKCLVFQTFFEESHEDEETALSLDFPVIESLELQAQYFPLHFVLDCPALQDLKIQCFDKSPSWGRVMRMIRVLDLSVCFNLKFTNISVNCIELDLVKWATDLLTRNPEMVILLYNLLPIVSPSNY
mmetsp:Transcript_48318/g.80314  ORF Transcript_48318/g.80314 Transcript_48318/m.80314 type:complete len:358 (-) Transcript_48318:151-1224(-)